MKLRSGLQMPEKSTWPSAVRGAGAAFFCAAAFGRLTAHDQSGTTIWATRRCFHEQTEPSCRISASPETCQNRSRML